MRARRLTDGQEVAIAFLDPTSEPVVPRRFDRLRRSLQRLSQDDVGIVPVLDSGTAPDGRPYLVMPYHLTGSLQDQLERGPTPWYPASRLIAEAAEIAGTAHDEGIVLGDLRPSKILLATVDRPVIAAFGMATRRFDDGLPSYRAPETTNDDPGTPAADVYALCLILGALVTGRPMAPDEEIGAFLIRVADQAPDRILEVLEHGLSLSPTNRPGTGSRLGGALRQALAADPDTDTDTDTVDSSSGQHTVDLDRLLASEPDEDVLGFEPSAEELQVADVLGPEALPPDLGDIVFVDRRETSAVEEDPTTSLPSEDTEEPHDPDVAPDETDDGWVGVAATITVNDLRPHLLDPQQRPAEDRVDIDADIDIDTAIFPSVPSDGDEAETEVLTNPGEVPPAVAEPGLNGSWRHPNDQAGHAEVNAVDNPTDNAEDPTDADISAADNRADLPTDNAEDPTDADISAADNRADLPADNAEDPIDADISAADNRADLPADSAEDPVDDPTDAEVDPDETEPAPTADSDTDADADAETEQSAEHDDASDTDGAIGTDGPSDVDAATAHDRPAENEDHRDRSGSADAGGDASATGEGSDGPSYDGPNGGGLDREVVDLSELFARTIEFVPPTATVDLALDARPSSPPVEPMVNGDSTNHASRTVEPPGETEPERNEADQSAGPQPPRLPQRTTGWVDDDQTELFGDQPTNGSSPTNGHEPELVSRTAAPEWSAQSRDRHMQAELDWLTGVKVRLELMWFRGRRTAATLGAVLGLLLIAAIVIFFAAQELRSGGGTIQTEGLPGPTPRPPAAPESSLTVPSTFVGAETPFIPDVAPLESSTTSTTTAVVRRAVVTATEPPTTTSTTEPTTTETTTTSTTETTIEVLPTSAPDGSTTEPDDTAPPPTSPPSRPPTTKRNTTTRPGRPTISVPTSWPPGNGGDAVVANQPTLIGPQATSVGRRGASLSYSSPSCVATRFLLRGDDGTTQSGSSNGYDASIACSTSWQLDFGNASALRSDTDYTLTVWIKDAAGRTSTAKVDFTTRP